MPIFSVSFRDLSQVRVCRSECGSDLKQRCARALWNLAEHDGARVLIEAEGGITALVRLTGKRVFSSPLRHSDELYDAVSDSNRRRPP
jgi:hypothetical protein